MKKGSSVKDAWRLAGKRLLGGGIGAGDFEAEVMLRFLLGWDRTKFFLGMEELLPMEVEKQLNKWVESRLQGIPLQHLTGEQEFFGRPFAVNPHVLIPRPETEGLVETVLQEAENLFGDAPLQVADVGTGSGILAITLAVERPHWQITAIDQSPQALVVARENAKRHGVEKRIDFRQGEWLNPMLEDQKKLDVLVSNPPYIPTSVVEQLDREVRDYEPRLALDGGEDGLTPYRILTEQISLILKRPGLVAFEIGWDQGVQVASMSRSLPGANEPKIIPDLAGRDRVVAVSIQS
ncbi:peptide chain release factor N(5)-glutamine methyltransferase [Marininema mesophilum]|uniref:peptide chain release factor N(5)-glutamine methyltransferase n=1 Tax=Marininema mesophilum TaxID=1048340 RepID=UPI001FDF9BAA|nr:peptide chain release factor N(5)-glutamine methyltransferase [Marininema mesophilum]